MTLYLVKELVAMKLMENLVFRIVLFSAVSFALMAGLDYLLKVVIAHEESFHLTTLGNFVLPVIVSVIFAVGYKRV